MRSCAGWLHWLISKVIILVADMAVAEFAVVAKGGAAMGAFLELGLFV